MSENTTSSEFLLLFRDTRWHDGLSPEETQRYVSAFMAWFDQLMEEGKLKAGQPLAREGRIVSSKGGRGIADGPFVESKEAVGGYFLLQVGSLEEAVEIARQCPGIEHGLTVEVRPIAEQCPIMERLNEELAVLNGQNA